MVGQYPLGGVAWDYFHYLLGLSELGHDVYYHEDTWCWPFDPVKGYPSDDPTYSVDFLKSFFDKHAPHLADRWHYLFLHENSFGMQRERFDEIARTADLFLNVSGASFFPEALNPKAIKVFMDTDPGYNQIMLHERHRWSQNVDRWCAQVASHDRHLTYAENIFGDDCTLPRLDFDWRPTRCVVTLPPWEHIRQTPPKSDSPYTTVMSWTFFGGPLIYNGVEYGAKGPEFERFNELPRRTHLPLLVAIAGHHKPGPKIVEAGWNMTDGWSLTLTPESYMKLIGDSAGEWSIAKKRVRRAAHRMVQLPHRLLSGGRPSRGGAGHGVEQIYSERSRGDRIQHAGRMHCRPRKGRCRWRAPTHGCLRNSTRISGRRSGLAADD